MQHPLSELEFLEKVGNPGIVANMACFAMINRRFGSLLISNGQDHFGVGSITPDQDRQLILEYRDGIGEVKVVVMYGETREEVDARLRNKYNQRMTYVARQKGVN